MSRPASHKSGGGETPNHQQKKLHGGSQGPSRKSHKKSAKRSITNKVKSRHDGAGIEASDAQAEDDEANSSAIEEQKASDDEPDVIALSDADGVPGATQCLAGPHDEDDDMFHGFDMSDEAHAVAGAERDDVGSDDDDDGYGDLGNVSDSEESDCGADESDVLRSAERDLIDEFEKKEERRSTNAVLGNMHSMVLDDDEAFARRLSLQGTESHTYQWGSDLAINMDDDPFFGLAQNDNLYRDLLDEADDALWRMPETVRGRDTSDAPGATQKRVRFEEVVARSPSFSGSDDANDAFPDLFTAFDDPATKRRIALGMEADVNARQNDFADAESFYDFEGDEEKLAFEIDEESDSDDDTSSYDSDDEGDTTDEESREEVMARVQERRRVATENGSRPNMPPPPKRDLSNAGSAPSTPRPATPKTGKAPKIGTFIKDATRPTITTNAQGKPIIFPPTEPLEKDKAFWERVGSESRNSSRRNSYITMPGPNIESVPERPFTAKSTLGSMFNGNLAFLRNNDLADNLEDCLPLAINSQASFTTLTTTEDSDTDHQDINMEDFLDMDQSVSDSDGPPSAQPTSPAEPNMFDPLVSSGSRADRRGSDILDHFDQCRGAIGSFRRNQNYAKHVSSLASHPAQRASAHEYNALQKGRRGAANTPMTPARRKRVSQESPLNAAGVRKSINSPLSARRPRSRGNSHPGIPNANLLQTLTRSPFE